MKHYLMYIFYMVVYLFIHIYIISNPQNDRKETCHRNLLGPRCCQILDIHLTVSSVPCRLYTLILYVHIDDIGCILLKQYVYLYILYILYIIYIIYYIYYILYIIYYIIYIIYYILYIIYYMLYVIYHNILYIVYYILKIYIIYYILYIIYYILYILD